MKEMSQTLRSAFKRVLRIENRRRVIRPGRLETIEGFQSEILGNSRNLTVYLPPGYDERGSETRYPVLYMHDGQNLFDPRRSFIPGQHWRLSEAADESIASRRAEPMIIVGIDNTGPDRIHEYTPTRDDERDAGGRAEDYGRMLAEELKPVIDAGYRTRPEREHTAIGGSSLGGLLSLYLVLHRFDLFTRAAVMSPSVWWHDRSILPEVEAFDARGERPRIWLDIGGREGREALSDARALRDLLRSKGWSDADLCFYEDRRADHSEGAWANRVKSALEFLFATE
jgi:predicted alpha/beta superfamily hydrolase